MAATLVGIALITGAAKRIGRAIALGLAKDGWDIAIHYHHSRAEAESLGAELSTLGRRSALLDCDLADTGQVEQLLARCRESLGAPTCLINNASIFEYDDAANFTALALDRHLRINLQAPLVLARECARLLPAKARGCLVNVLDQKLAALNPDFYTYTVSKVALGEATRLMAMAYAPRVRVNAIAPGVALPSAYQSAANFEAVQRQTALGYGCTVEDIVAAVRYVVSAPALTGETIVVDAGQHLFPTRRDIMFEVE